jgi:hypothetical protein
MLQDDNWFFTCAHGRNPVPPWAVRGAAWSGMDSPYIWRTTNLACRYNAPSLRALQPQFWDRIIHATHSHGAPHLLPVVSRVIQPNPVVGAAPEAHQQSARRRALLRLFLVCSSSVQCSGRTGWQEGLLALSAGFLTSAALLGQAFDAEATRIEYYATVGDKMCDMNLVNSELAYCDVEVGTGAQPPRGELINASTGTKRFRLVSLRIRMLISFPLLFAKDQIAVL